MKQSINNSLLIIGLVWPEPKSSAAGSRMMQLIQFFLAQGYEITFASNCAKTVNAYDLDTIGVIQKRIDLNNSSFDNFIKDLEPSVVLFDRFMTEEQFGWRVAEHCPSALRILDTEDLHGLRKGRQQAFNMGEPFNKTFLFNDTAKRELASIIRSDLSLIISEAEMVVLHEHFKVDSSRLLYLPFMLEGLSQSEINAAEPFRHRDHFITIGNFLHEPNYQAILHLKKMIWPLIKKQLPEAKLFIYGAYSSQKITQLNNTKQGFLINGYVDDAIHVMQKAKVCLAPLPFGAGLKGKIIDAMTAGTPCVMSSIAAEGLFGSLNPNGFITDTPEEFAQKSIKLYTDDLIWDEKQSNGFKIINERFNKSHFYNLLKERLDYSLNHIQELREQNFMGQMLQHHQLQSTRYMSKWIEAKNKLRS